MSAHWRANRRAMAVLLAIWFAVPYGLGIVFVALIAAYAVWMDRIDRRHGEAGGERPEADERD